MHLVVDDPTLFPLQPEEPIIPTIAIALCLYLLWIGSGSWSLDLRKLELSPGAQGQAQKGFLVGASIGGTKHQLAKSGQEDPRCVGDLLCSQFSF